MALDVFKIPLTNNPQEFDLTLSGKNLIAITQFNSFLDTWTISLLERSTREPLILSMPMITGANLLAQYDFLGFVGGLYIYTDADPDSSPTYENLGSESNLYYIVERENE